MLSPWTGRRNRWLEMLGEGGGKREGERKTTRRKERGTECETYSIQRM
jgi:hypothetical protein